MMLWLRNLAEMWADGRYVKANEVLRQRLIHAEAAVERQGQAMRQTQLLRLDVEGKLSHANALVAELRDELRQKADQIQRQANLFEQMRDQADALRRQRDDARSREAELEQAVVAMSAASGLDAAWPDVAAVCGAQSETLGRQ